MRDQGVEEGGETFVGTASQVFVVESEMLFAEALQNQHHHVFGLEGQRVNCQL